MGSGGWPCVVVCFFLFFLAAVRSTAAEEGTVFVDGRNVVGRIDEDFVCATVDWWPPEKCDYDSCSWGHASFLNLDLNNTILKNAIKAFRPLKLRLGGTLQDAATYQTEPNQPCIPFIKNSSIRFGFAPGCLPRNRWDELNSFFQKFGVKVFFGLNALTGREIRSDGLVIGAWNYTNAESFIRYTVGKNYTIHGWELGNELSGKGVGARISAYQYANDTLALWNIVKRVYGTKNPKPLVIAPGGFFDQGWFQEFLERTRTYLDVATHHIYSLGSGRDNFLMKKILNPEYLDGDADTFSGLKSVLKSSNSSAVAWVGEAGGTYNSGQNLVSNAFAYSFWYMDQMGMAAAFDTKTYCRQSLIGGNYGLLNTTNFNPNPDYYSALLWHQLMGRNVLSASFHGSKKIRSYAHCAKQSKGITVLLINLDSNKTIDAKIEFNHTSSLRQESQKAAVTPSPNSIHQTGNKREEYHLTAKDGNLHSQTVLLNGKILGITATGDIPSLEPVKVESTAPITIAPLSIVFVHVPDVVLPACS